MANLKKLLEKSIGGTLKFGKKQVNDVKNDVETIGKGLGRSIKRATEVGKPKQKKEKSKPKKEFEESEATVIKKPTAIFKLIDEDKHKLEQDDFVVLYLEKDDKEELISLGSGFLDYIDLFEQIHAIKQGVSTIDIPAESEQMIRSSESIYVLTVSGYIENVKEGE